MTDDKVLIRPDSTHLDAYAAALAKGWSPNNLRPEAAEEELARIRDNPKKLLAEMDDELALGDPVKLPDGQVADRLPGIRRFIWDGEFCGICSLRWAKDKGDLPSHVLGHIGYAVVPWKTGQGLATRALGELVVEAAARSLPYVDLTTDPDNAASIKVVLRNGGVLRREFEKPEIFGGGRTLLYRISLPR